jgi:hypothetical protein
MHDLGVELDGAMRPVHAERAAVAVNRHKNGHHIRGVHSAFRSRAQMRGSYLHGHGNLRVLMAIGGETIAGQQVQASFVVLGLADTK